jgi:molybdate transport system substrate-binding protein
MRFGLLAAALKIGSVVVFAQCMAVQAAEIKVLAGGVMSAVLGELGPEFERATLHKLMMQHGLAPALQRRIEAGEAFDVVIVNFDSMEALSQQGKIAAGTRADFASIGIDVAVRAGAPKPDLRSVDAFRRAMLNAKSITYEPGNSTAIHLAGVFERLGIADQMKAKTRSQPTQRGTQAVANGEIELAFGPANNLRSVDGVELLGTVAPELQKYLVFVAAVGTGAKEPEAAQAFINFLMRPEAIEVIKAKGMERRAAP